ncbi:MAG TPA: hypothetical protein DEQ09_08430 [Bacteroidales bacterium]|nr:hypothetical protein [Bacteroidales bacterium]
MKYLKYIIIILITVLMSSCFASRQNPYARKKKKNSYVSATQLGRNKYFFTNEYQRKLKKNYKKKRY